MIETCTGGRCRLPLAFVDSSAWIALMVPKDRNHQRAREMFRNLPARTRLITSDYVVEETVTWLVYHGMRPAAFKLRDLLTAAQQQNLASIEWVTPFVYETAWQLLERYHDQALSFCDCASFALCGGRNVDFVFGFDNDFRLAGFDLRPGTAL